MQTKRYALRKVLLVALSVATFQLLPLTAAAQNAGQGAKPDPDKIAEDETARMESDLLLEDWQVFYVDSILRHNYAEMLAEMEALQRSAVTNSDMFYVVRDKWNERSQEAFRKIFTEQQWKTYMRSGGEKEMRDRQKRREKVQKAQEYLDNKK